jgi:hypothetical protein
MTRVESYVIPHAVRLSVLAKGQNMRAKIDCPYDIMAARVYEPAQGFKLERASSDA